MPLLGRSRPQQFGNPNRQSLTAAGARVRSMEAEILRRINQPWQQRSFAYFDILGEIHYASGFYAHGLANLGLYAAETNDDGELVPTENEEAKVELDRLQDPGGGRTEILSQYGRLMFLTGEAMLLCSVDSETSMEQWEMLSTDEIRPNQTGRGFQRYRAPMLAPEVYKEPTDDDWDPVDDEAVVYRIWQRHPRYSFLADSTMRGVLDLCEELVMLTQAVRARARSRLAGNGILFIDGRISKAPPEPRPGEDPQEDKFVASLTEAMLAPIADEGAASAVAPLVVRVPVPDAEKQLRVADMVAHVQLVDPTQLYPETGLRMELIKRLAVGLDMPPERLTGLGETSHWNAWEITDDEWTNHLQPLARAFVDALTQSYYRPTLRDRGLEDWWRYSIAYDESQVVTKPDKGPDAKDVHKAGALSDEALRRETGFDEEDAPTDDEQRRWLSVYSRDPGFATGDDPRGTGGNPLERAVEPPPDEAPVQDKPPRPENDGQAANGRRADAELDAARIVGAADLALRRARECAGNRILAHLKRWPAELADVRDARVATGDLAAHLGRDECRRLKVPAEQVLVAGARDLILDSLRVWGLDAGQAGAIADNVEQHAVRTLYDPKPPAMPPTFGRYVLGVTAGR